jgi:hypothetical protein
MRFDSVDFTATTSREEEVEAFYSLQNYLLEQTQQNKPFFIGRLSGNEANISSHILVRAPIPPYLVHNMLFGAGIQIKTMNDAIEYFNTYTRSCTACNMIGVWGGAMYNQAIPFYQHLKTNVPSMEAVYATNLEPYYYMDDPGYRFPAIFKDKKVLVVSSHRDTINAQLGKLDKLFSVQMFHPTTEFYVYKPPQQNAGNHDENTWQEHFAALKTGIRNLREDCVFDFDIALVSCGGFGMPICHYIFSEMGKSAIYVGGALQLFFGIMGNRWKSSPNILKHVNSHWTSTLSSDLPLNPQLCENSSYW